jgi:AcrR family transcriptional regulator
MRLAVARGLDAVTVEAIADEADVSRRTFSNYFANKEDALLHGDRARMRRILAALRERPPGEPPWQALRHSAAALFRDDDPLDPQWVAQTRLVRRHPRCSPSRWPCTRRSNATWPTRSAGAPTTRSRPG